MAPNLQSDDYYEILGCPRGASDDVLRKAYRKLAVKWHPDKNPGNEEATKNFQKISEAYATLSDEKKRKIYDQYGKDAANQADQMGESGASHFPGGGGGPGFHFSTGGPGGGGMSHMSQEEADLLFSHIFGGGDPFGSAFGGMPGRRSRVGGDPFASMFGGGPGGSMRQGMGGFPGGSFGGMPGGSFGGGMPGGSFGGMPGASSGYSKRYDAIPNGTVVSFKGLVSHADRNGDRGEIQGFDPASGRYVVVVEDSDETLRVKPSNLLQHVHVRLEGIESQPALNGARGTVIAWNEQKERYNIFVNGKVVSLKPSNVILENGTVAYITGLQAKPEMNGRFGTISSWNRESNRYDVQLSADQILRLKVSNLRV